MRATLHGAVKLRCEGLTVWRSGTYQKDAAFLDGSCPVRKSGERLSRKAYEMRWKLCGILLGASLCLVVPVRALGNDVSPQVMLKGCADSAKAYDFEHVAFSDTMPTAGIVQRAAPPYHGRVIGYGSPSVGVPPADTAAYYWYLCAKETRDPHVRDWAVLYDIRDSYAADGDLRTACDQLRSLAHSTQFGDVRQEALTLTSTCPYDFQRW
jgi:hypothetical protein